MSRSWLTKKRDLIVSQVFREYSLSPGHYTQKYSEKMDNEGKKTTGKVTVAWEEAAAIGIEAGEDHSKRRQ